MRPYFFCIIPNINFHYRTNSVEINDHIQKPYFWPISLIVGVKKVFAKKSGSVMYNLYGFLVLCQNSEKPNDPVPRKHPHKSQDGMMDRFSFIGSFWQLPSKYNCSRLTFKILGYRVLCCINQKLLHHSQHAKNQLNS